jgi:hypothetical protein
MTVLRRLLVMCALMFWIGGFTFYAAVVVPIGTEVLGGPVAQGEITRHVAKWLNLAGAVALILWAWDLAIDRAPRVRQWLRWLLWGTLVVMLALLGWWHPRLEELRDLPHYYSQNRAAFRSLHRFYLWTSSIQWGVALLLLVSTLRTWHANDRTASHPVAK